MSWHPNDLISDWDLVAYESTLTTHFGQTDWEDKRRKALEDWLFPILRANGFDPHRLRTRFEPTQVLGYTGSAYTDLTDAAINGTADDVDLAAVFATPGTDRLYVGAGQMFRGLSVRMLDAVSAVAGTLSVHYWADTWRSLPLSNATIVSGAPFGKGGAVLWTAPSDWVARGINDGDAGYFVRVTLSATPTGAKAGQIGAIRRSALCAPATFRALTLIMREAPAQSAGPWLEKAVWYEREANLALERALPLLGGEFDTDASDQVSAEEAAQTASEVGGGWSLERA